MEEERDRQKEIPKESHRDPTGQVREKLESEGLDPDLSAVLGTGRRI